MANMYLSCKGHVNVNLLILSMDSPAGTTILDFRLPERETVHFCCFQRPKLCGTWSQQPEEMDTEALNAIVLSEKKKKQLINQHAG